MPSRPDSAWRSATRLAIAMIAVVPGLALVLSSALAARLMRQNRTRSRVVLGTTPIISLSFIATALRHAGYSAKTLVHEPYAISRRQDFDRVVGDLPLISQLSRAGLRPFARALGPYIAFAWTARNADVLCCFFDGGPLAGSLLQRWEPTLLHLAGCRIVVMPYGSDNFVASRTSCIPWRDGVLASYPHLGRDEAIIEARIQRWCAAADRVIACVVHRETLPRWDVLTTHYYPIDTTCWTPAPHHPERDGQAAEVVVGHTPNHRAVKGTDHLINAIEQLRGTGLKIRIDLMEGIPNEQVRERLANCDILVEQLHLGYALSAMEGMALGRPVVSNLTDDSYYAIHRKLTGLDACPIVNGTPENIAETLRRLAVDPALRQRLGEQGRIYTERFHSIPVLARFWDLLLRSMVGNGAIRRDDMLVWHPERGYPDDRSW